METVKLKTAINNLITKADYAMHRGDYKAASEFFRTVTVISEAIDGGATDGSEYGRYLIEYAAGKHR